MFGTGGNDVDPLAEGTAVDLVTGPQGGHHIEIGLLMTGFDTEERLTAVLTAEVDGTPVGGAQPYLEPFCDASTDELLSRNLYLIFDAFPADVDGQTATVAVLVSDARGATAAASLNLSIRDMTEDVP